MTEKQKRFRVHVVKEIFDTEREYTRSLEFTVTVSGWLMLKIQLIGDGACTQLCAHLAILSCMRPRSCGLYNGLGF